MPHAGWRRWGWGLGGPDQQPLSGQSWERDPGLLSPALSLDLHSNRHQGTELKAWAMWLPAGGRGICLCSSSFVGKGLWAGFLSQERETEHEAGHGRKDLTLIQR